MMSSIVFFRDILRINARSKLHSSARCWRILFDGAQRPQPHVSARAARRLSSAMKCADEVTQLSVCRPFGSLSNCGFDARVRLAPHLTCPLLTVVRFRRRKMHGKKHNPSDESAEEEAETDEEDNDEGDVDVSTISFEEDSLLTHNYRELTKHIKSPRLDAVVGAGLGIPRNQVDELFLSSQLRLNGQRLQKKGQQIQEGDYVDHVFTSDEGTSKFKRIRVLRIEEGATPDKVKIYLRAWRSPQSA